MSTDHESDYPVKATGSGAPAESGDPVAEIDGRIVDLLNERARLALGTRGDAGAGGFRPEGESLTLERVSAAGAGPLGPAALRAIYVEVLGACRALAGEVRIGYLGPAGTFSHEAALRRFGSGATLVPCATIEDVFRETERGNVAYGLVPIENSTAGAVIPSLEAFLDSELQVCGEVELPIAHNLMSRGDLGGIKRVYSHPQSFAQCRRWLAKNVPNAEQIEVASNALAVQMADSAETAAVGPAAAGRIYGVPVIVEHVEDVSTNITRFLLLGRSRGERTGRDKCAIAFSMKNRPGVLRDSLDTFAKRGIDLTRIESRPERRGLWNYVFFADLAGHPDDPDVAAALAELAEISTFVKVLGAWRVATERSER